MAIAAEVYAKRQKLGKESIDYAHTVIVDAKALLGEFWKATKKAKGGGPGTGKKGRKKASVPVGNRCSESPPTVAELGLTKKETSEAA
jgi:hypothetical protein